MKIWIDFSNSPHPLLFAPIARRLEREGQQVLITARDNAQTLELARERWPNVEVIGAESPKGRVAKATLIAQRVADLRRWAKAIKPDVALSHNSYAQIVAARSLRVPVVTAMDFEHQPANHLAFRLARTILLPEALPLAYVRRQGATRSKVVSYPGLKEELYIGDFEPDEAILAKVGIESRPRIVAIARTPPSRAAYHGFGNSLFDEALSVICAQDDVVCVALTRHPEQLTSLAAMGLHNLVVPETAIDSRSLICAADVMIGAGGTMTREAALLGTPTWTVFAGKRPVVDAWLERRGQLARLESAKQLARLEPRPSPPRTPQELRSSAAAIEDVVIGATLAAKTRSRKVGRD